MLVKIDNHKHHRFIADAIRRLTLLCLVCFSLGAPHFAWSSVSCSCEEKCDPFCVEDVIDDCFDEGEENGGPPTGRPVAKGSVDVATKSSDSLGGTPSRLEATYQVRLTSEGRSRIGEVRSATLSTPITIDLYVRGEYIDTAYLEYLSRDGNRHGFTGRVIFNAELPATSRHIEVRATSPDPVIVESMAGRTHNLRPRKGTTRSDPNPIP